MVAQVRMRFRHLMTALMSCALIIFVLSSLQPSYAQGFVQYRVQLNADGSASWTITQALDLNGTIDSWRGFQQRVDNLVSSAANLTQREMAVDPSSLQLNTVWENQSETTTYQFTWINCSVLQGNEFVFGDVFRLNGFFSQLYGDGELQITYPQNYTVSSVSPQPNGGNIAPETLDWLGTDFFVNGNPSIVIVPSASPSPPPQASMIGSSLYAIIASIAIVAVAIFSVSTYLLRRRKIHKNDSSTRIPPSVPLVESEEEKVLKIVQANGGSIFQTAIKNQCNFSKSKTSQLLASLEKRGMVRRYKKGRDKIVTLTEQSETEGELS